jgi:hypothetical protein
MMTIREPYERRPTAMMIVRRMRLEIESLRRENEHLRVALEIATSRVDHEQLEFERQVRERMGWKD